MTVKSDPTFLGVDSLSILFKHRPFPKTDRCFPRDCDSLADKNERGLSSGFEVLGCTEISVGKIDRSFFGARSPS